MAMMPKQVIERLTSARRRRFVGRGEERNSVLDSPHSFPTFSHLGITPNDHAPNYLLHVIFVPFVAELNRLERFKFVLYPYY